MSDAQTGQRPTVDGYVADSDYPSAWHSHFDPAWIDAIIEMRGLAPPRAERAPFVKIDLGCGDGLGLLAEAASHAEGQFIGTDALPGHVARGQWALGQLGLDNARILEGTFAAPPALEDGCADYVTAQGVLAWVSPANRAHVLALASRLLKPGGVLAMGYNSMPGWQLAASYQRLVRAIAQDMPGSPVERYEAARDQIRALGLAEARFWHWYDSMPDRLPRDYFPHEYLNGHWQPLWAGDVIEACSALGLTYAGDAAAARQRDDLTLRKAWREALAQIDGIAAREIALDLMLNRWFRHDLYVKGEPRRIDAAEARTRRLARPWMATTRSDEHGFAATTAAGTIRFDNEAARAILATLRKGPAALATVPDIGAADLLNSADALFVAGLIRPCASAGPGDAPAAFNRWRSDAGISLNALAGYNGPFALDRATDPATIEADAMQMIGVPQASRAVA